MFNYTRNILNEQEKWKHTPLIPRPVIQVRYTHSVFCRYGCTPPKGAHIVRKRHYPKAHRMIYVVRDVFGQGITIKRLLPPEPPNCPPLGDAD